jgi:hypothetical protein
MICDTNPTLAALAAIRAVWAAIPFMADDTLVQRMEACILRKSELTPGELEWELTR